MAGSVVKLEGRRRGEHPVLILKMENASCPFGLQKVAHCPFQNIKKIEKYTIKYTILDISVKDLCYILTIKPLMN